MKLTFFEQDGNYNLMDSSDYETQWYVTIKNDDGKILELDGKRCRLFWCEDGDQRSKYSMHDGIQELVNQAWKHAQSNFGSTDYKGEIVAFVKAYRQYQTELVSEYENSRREQVVKQIAKLQDECKYPVLGEDEHIDFAAVTKDTRKKLEGWVESSLTKLQDYKEGTPSFTEESARIERYRKELKNITDLDV